MWAVLLLGCSPERTCARPGFHADRDGDGDGEPAEVSECGIAAVVLATDCDDDDPAVHPGAVEQCSTPYDDDCDGSTNAIDAVDCADWYEDHDGDGLGDGNHLCLCSAYDTYVVPGDTDCSGLDPALDCSNARRDGEAGARITGGEGNLLPMGDADGDGDPDLAIDRYVVDAAEPVGDVILGRVASNPIALTLPLLGAGDLDGDGTADLVARDQGNHWVVFVGFGPWTRWNDDVSLTAVDCDAYESTAAHIADLDGDGIADLLGPTGDTDGDCPLGFLPAGGSSGAAVDPGGLAEGGLDAADLDGDGQVELLQAHGELTITTGPLVGAPEQLHIDGPSALSSVHTGDLDGDGYLDVLVSGDSSAVLRGPAPWSTNLSTDAWLWVSGAGHATVAELDGDAGGELVFTDGVLGVLLDPTPGTWDRYAADRIWAAPRAEDLEPLTDTVWSLGDLDGDGVDSLVTVAQTQEEAPTVLRIDGD